MRLRRIFTFGIVTILLLVVLLGAGVAVVRSRVFHQYLLATAVRYAQQAIGGRVELGDFTFQLWGLRADLYRIAVHGREPNPRTPLFSADHLAVDLGLVSIWKRKVDLQEIVVDHPVVHLSVDSQGRTNLPQTPPPAPGTKPVSLFDLAIGHFVVFEGEIYYNDRQTRLDAEVCDLQTQVSFDASKTAYGGALSYHQGHVQFGSFSPLQHDFQTRFTATPSRLTLDSMALASAPFRISADVRLEDYSNPSVEGSYEAAISGGQLGKLLKNRSLPRGQLTTKGTVYYRNTPQQPALNGLSIEGRLDSPELALDLPEVRANLRSFRGEYRLKGSTLEARNVQAELLGGQMAANMTMLHLAGKPQVRLEAAVRGVSLAATNAALRSKPLKEVELTGRLDGTISAGWRGSLEGLQVRSDATIAAQAPVGQRQGHPSAIPVEGALHLGYDAASDVLSLQRTYLRTPQTTLTLDGTLGNQSRLGIKVQSGDLHEIDLLTLAVRASAAPPDPPDLVGLGGSISFDGQLQGKVKDPRLTGQVGGENVRYQNTTLRALRARLDLASSGIALHEGQIQTSPQGRVEFDITADLTDWSYGTQSPLSLRVAASKLPLADLQQMANLRYPVTGFLSANISLQGSQSNPVGQGSVRLSEARAWDQPIQELSLDVESNGNVIHSRVNARTAAGMGNVKATYYPGEEKYDVQLDFPGIHLDKVEALRARHLPVTGTLKVSAQGRGVLKEPQLEATVEASKLEWQQQALDGLKMHAALAQQQATFTLDSSVSGAFVQARGMVSLNSDYDATANVDTRIVELGPLLASYVPGHFQDLRGQSELHGWLKGPLKRPERLEAHVEIPRLSLSYQALQIASASPILIGYRDGVLALERAQLKGTGTDLQLQAVVPFAPGGNLRVTAVGNVDLHILQVLNPTLDSSGQIKLDIGAQGTRASPQIHGTVRVVDAAFQAPDAPLGAEKVNAQLEVQKDRVDIKSFAAETGGGNVTAQGFVTYQPAVQFNVKLSAKQVRLRYPEGVRAELGSDLSLNGTPDSALLNGQVLIQRLSFTESCFIATFADQFTGPSSPPTEGIAQNIKLDVALRSAEEVGLTSSNLSMQGSADLRVRGTVAEPVLLGRANITGGELFFNERRYEVQSGLIQFANPVRTEPVVNLSVTTTVDQFNINLNFAGPFDHLRTTYTSDPALPPVDVINLLLMGHTTEAAAKSPTTPQSVLAGQLAGQVGSRVGKLAGISSLTIDPQIGGNQRNAGARLAIQQRVTKDLFFTFATDVTTSQGQVFQVEYQATRKYSLSAMRNQNGGYSLQVKVRKQF
jgi:translocation and assembly module TamB